jgi:hypothetical protein
MMTLLIGSRRNWDGAEMPITWAELDDSAVCDQDFFKQNGAFSQLKS